MLPWHEWLELAQSGNRACRLAHPCRAFPSGTTHAHGEDRAPQHSRSSARNEATRHATSVSDTSHQTPLPVVLARGLRQWRRETPESSPGLALLSAPLHPTRRSNPPPRASCPTMKSTAQPPRARAPKVSPSSTLHSDQDSAQTLQGTPSASRLRDSRPVRKALP